MPQSNPVSLWHSLRAENPARLVGLHTEAQFDGLIAGSALEGRGDEFRGRSVLVATTDQLTTALALIEIDGLARRIILCPSDLSPAHLPFLMELAGVDAIISDGRSLGAEIPYVPCVATSSPKLVAASYDRKNPCQTEWILLTSGTTGIPKLVVHTLASLTGAIQRPGGTANAVVWSTFYDVRRYGGLQIFLRAVLTGASLVLSDTRESTADFLARAGANEVTHISGTPSHWRRALMSVAAHQISPRYVRLSGEIADQAILSQLQSFFPQARVAHAFASTEAGVAFDVTDGLAGFPANLMGPSGEVEMKVQDGSLRIRSPRAASGYLGQQGKPLKTPDGFVDTGDMLELRGDRYYFGGRRDGVINVGGLKVHPEEVEAVINRHPQVRISLVRPKKNPITGALVIADVVLKTAHECAANDVQALQQDILLQCRIALPAHKVPAAINFVPSLTVAETGKLMRGHA